MIAFSKSSLNFEIPKKYINCLLILFSSIPLWTQSLKSPEVLKHSLIVERSFNKATRLWSIKYDYAFRIREKSTLGLQIGYMTGKEEGLVGYSPSTGRTVEYDKVKGIPLQFYSLWGNSKGHNFEMGAEFYIRLEDYFSLINLHTGYRFRPKEAGFTAGIHYKLIYQVFWVEHTANISLGFIF